MKPRTWTALGATAAGLLAIGCTPPSPAVAPREQADDGWTQPPTVTSARLAGATLIIGGIAEPRARVVLRNDAGAAYAVSADGRGAFEIRIAAPSANLLLQPETQVGQDAAASPEQLLIINGGKGPIAVLRPGSSARRLGASSALAAVDSDGRMTVASGLSSETLTVRTANQSTSVTPDATGRWSLMLNSVNSGAIQVGDRAYDWPGWRDPTADTTDPVVEYVGNGWQMSWMTMTGTRQSTWLPDA